MQALRCEEPWLGWKAGGDGAVSGLAILGCSGCISAYCCFRTCYEEGYEDVELVLWGLQTSLEGQHLAGVQLWRCFLHIVLGGLLSAGLGACAHRDGVQHGTGLLGWEPSSVLLCW